MHARSVPALRSRLGLLVSLVAVAACGGGDGALEDTAVVALPGDTLTTVALRDILLQAPAPPTEDASIGAISIWTDLAVDDSDLYWVGYSYFYSGVAGRANVNGAGLDTRFITGIGRRPESQSSSCGCRPITAPHCAPTRSALVIPTVQPSRAACATIWSVV